jgi:hypothetical protein
MMLMLSLSRFIILRTEKTCQILRLQEIKTNQLVFSYASHSNKHISIAGICLPLTVKSVTLTYIDSYVGGGNII